MAIRVSSRFLWSAATCVATLLAGCEAHAQLLGLNLRGDFGLKSGTQPHPGIYLTLPLYFGTNYEGLRDHDGNKVVEGLDLSTNLLGAPAMALTTKEKIFGGTLGLAAVLGFASSRVSIAQPDVTLSGGYGVTDAYVVPFSLGWWTTRADYKLAYAFFAPTGSGDRSLDMWAHEISAGSTVYFDAQQTWHFAATAFYEIHQKKNNADLRVGDILTFEGGVGGSFMKGAGSAGVAYVAQWKITNDSGDDFPALVPKSKSRVFGLGPDVTVPVFAKGTVIGLLNARYIWEFGGRSTFEGETFVAGFTLANLQLP